MTENEWLTGNDPQPMLEFLGGSASDRKVRLFACACCRAIWHLLPDRRCRKAIEVSERYADGSVTLEKLLAVRGDIRWAANAAERKNGDGGVLWCVAYLTESDSKQTLFGIWSAAYMGGLDRHLPLQCNLVRDIFGNPFRPVVADTAWLTPTVVSIAAAIYQDRAFDRLPILADALEEAGCTNADLLLHCRQPGEHIRGCWIVDLVLGKE